jgi:hypothetical protein
VEVPSGKIFLRPFGQGAPNRIRVYKKGLLKKMMGKKSGGIFILYLWLSAVTAHLPSAG